MNTVTATREAPLDVIATSFRASEQTYLAMGTPLFALFARHAADDAEMCALAAGAMEGARASHLFSAVHYLLLADPSDPLARWFATLTDDPLPPDDRAYRELVRFCRANRDELAELLRTRTVQTTYAERCRAILPALCEVAREVAREVGDAPLNLVEIGCSAGVLLVFDKFAYRYDGGPLIGDAAAPLVLEGSIAPTPELAIPAIGKRTGIDLHTIDAASPEERRWLLALCFPELRDEQARLARALDVVAATDIALLEGDGLLRLREAFAATPDPLCVFHSACLFYWPAEARAALDALFVEESQRRTIWRIGIEPSVVFDDWQKGTSDGSAAISAGGRTGEISLLRYADGAVTRRVLGYPNADYGTIDWVAPVPSSAG